MSVPTDLRTELAIQSRTQVRYRSSFLRVIVASAFILAYAVLGVIVLFGSLALTQYVRDQIPAIMRGSFDQAAVLRLAAPAVLPALLQTVCGIGALVFFAAWLSRVIMNIPALGGGVPGTTPTKAFIYPLIPFWNLFKTPPMIQDALYRLDPKAGGFFMIMIAWFGLVGSALIGFFAGWWVNLRIAAEAGGARSLDDAIVIVQNAYDTQIVIDVVTTLMSSFGAIVLVMIMFRIESRARARDGEIRTAAIAPRGEPGSVEARPGEAAVGTAAVAEARPIPGPLGSASAPTEPAMFVERPFAAATGVAAVAAAESVPQAGPAASVMIAPTPPAPIPGGPRLHLRIDSGTSMTATLEGESEAITLAELREAAAALARANGSATIMAADGSVEARSLAEQALEVLTTARVPATIEH